MRDLDTVQESEEKLIRLLDDAEMQLEETRYIAGDEFTLADTMFVPVLVRITLLNLEEEYINCRPKVMEYYQLVKHRNSYKVVIGKYFSGWRKHRTILKTLCFICIRSLFRAYWNFGSSSQMWLEYVGSSRLWAPPTFLPMEGSDKNSIRSSTSCRSFDLSLCILLICNAYVCVNYIMLFRIWIIIEPCKVDYLL